MHIANWEKYQTVRTHGRGVVFPRRFASAAEVMEQGNKRLEKKNFFLFNFVAVKADCIFQTVF